MNCFEKLSVFLSKGKNILLPIFIIIAGEMIFRPFYPGRQTLVGDWANFTVYLSFFILGYLFAYNSECIEKIVKNIHLFLVLSCVSALGFIFLRYAEANIEVFESYYNNREYQYKLCMAFLQGIAEYSLVILFIGIAKKYLNINNGLYKYLSKTSFALYMFHYLIVNLVMYYIIQKPFNHAAMYILSIVIVYSIFFIVFEGLIKRIFFLRYICGIKKEINI
jgi:hypothetical protein